MDFQSYCVQKSEKLDLRFPYLQFVVDQTSHIAKSFKIASRTFMENQSVSGMRGNLGSNRHFGMANTSKSEEFVWKKEDIGHINKMAPFTFSMLVGGFVGSKSQGGCSKRERYQIWDVMMDSFVGMKETAHGFFNVGEGIFGTLCGGRTAAFDFTSYLFTNQCKIFPNQEIKIICNSAHGTRNISTLNFTKSASESSDEIQCTDFPLAWHKSVESLGKIEGNCKQSYAEVAKSFAVMMTEMTNSKVLQDSNKGSNTFKSKDLFRLNRNNKNNKRKNCISNKTYDLKTCEASQKSQNISIMSSTKDQTYFKLEQVDDKSCRTYQFQHKAKYTCNPRRLDTHNIRYGKTGNLSDSRRSKGRTFSTKRKGKKDIEHFVHEETSYVCGMSAEDCKNWRCQHNRTNTLYVTKESAHLDVETPVIDHFRTSTPNTLSEDLLEHVDHIPDITTCDYFSEPEEETIVHNRINVLQLENAIKSNSSSSSQCITNCSDSLHSSSAISVAFGERTRILSECSVESEDSFIEFKYEDNQCGSYTEDKSDNLDIEEESEDEDEEEEDEDEMEEDEVEEKKKEDKECEDGKTSSCEDCNNHDQEEKKKKKLIDINEKWRKDNLTVPAEEKAPKKVVMWYVNPSNLFCDKADDYDLGIDSIDIIDIEEKKKRKKKLIDIEEKKKRKKKLNDINEKWRKDNLTVPAEEKAPKKVRFAKATVHLMRTWKLAHHKARCGTWKQDLADRCRFQKHIDDTAKIIEPILDMVHRQKVYKQRMYS